MKKKRLFLFALLFVLIFSMPAFAHEKKQRGTVCMGEVQEVQKDENNSVLMIRVKGYLKSCKVYEEEIVAIVSENTVIIPKECVKKKEVKQEKTKPMELQVEKGDVVFIVLNDAMTKSIPPQVGAKAIQISRPTE